MFIEAFIRPERRDEFLQALSDPRRRLEATDRITDQADLDLRFADAMPQTCSIAAELRFRGAPTMCHVISCDPSIDGRNLSLHEALMQIESGGFGAIVSCIPGKLAYYSSECGEDRVILQR